MNGHPWPIFDLRISTERLELRLPTDEELLELLGLAQLGIHDPSEMPFGIGWTDAPSPQFERGFMQFHWSCRANWTPADWTLNLGVWAAGRLVGTQGLSAREFATLRSVATGSWLGRKFQGQGFGKQMRSAVLALAFDHLGASWATSTAFGDNKASLGVSTSLGYVDDGLDPAAPRGELRMLVRKRLSVEKWRSRERPSAEVRGLERCLELFGTG